jgi:hypothetical protein
MGDIRTYTFLPKEGSLYSGGREADDHIAITGKYLASYNRKEVFPYLASRGLNEKEQAYIANAMGNNAKAVYTLDHVDKNLKTMQAARLKMEHYEKLSRGEGRFDASIQRAYQAAYEEYRAAEINGTNTDQLTIVQFVNKIVGNIENASYVASAFKNIPLDKLRGKIPEMGWPGVNVQVKRLSEPEINQIQFGQDEFRIYRNDVHIYMSREDRMEATIDPFTTAISQGQKQMIRARELLALQACSNLEVNATYGTLPDITATPSGSSAPASTNDAPKAFVNVMLGHFNTYYNYLKYFIFNPLDYRTYLANWFTHAYERIQIPEGFGVVPMFGLEKYGAIAIISPYVARTVVYALTDEGAFELDGPYMVDSEYDAKKFADYNIVHDFIGYQIMNPVRFGEKLSLPQSGVSAGTEITTNGQIAALLQPPANLVVKNTNPA